MNEFDDTVIALAQHLNVAGDKAALEEIDEGRNGYSDIYNRGESYSYEGQTYAVLLDCEADTAQEEALDSYIDDCILPELPSQYQSYFDSDAFKRDAKFDGRGHIINPYDGREYEEQVNGVWFYIYRTDWA